MSKFLFKLVRFLDNMTDNIKASEYIIIFIIGTLMLIGIGYFRYSYISEHFPGMTFFEYMLVSDKIRIVPPANEMEHP